MVSLEQKYYQHFLDYAHEYFSDGSYARVVSALEEAASALAEYKRYDGSPMICHSIEMAMIVMREIGLGRNSVISTLLHDMVRIGLMTIDQAEAKYGRNCVVILKGLCNISDVDTNMSEQQKENFKELIVSYSTDPRVILIKLADRLEVMRSLSIFPPEKQRKKSWESLNLYSQIAHKLGLYAIKSELEDISLRYLEPKDYDHIRRRLAESEKERADFIAEFIKPINKKLVQQGFTYHIKSRSKSIYSIWRKMKKNKLTIDEIYDLFAIRIIIDCPIEQEKPLCWNVYSIVTDFYMPNPERMRDWISIPKSNGYESLHTTVVTGKGRWVEIQIRSERMDEVAERGVAAHWRYKGVENGGLGSDDWLSKLRSIIETSESQSSIAERFDTKMSTSEVFVFTPNGDIRKLSKGATVLDFAFDIHTGLGSICTGGRIAGRIVPMKEPLKNGDIVEIMTSKNQHPKADWLNIAVTSKARGKIKSYLREEQAKAANLGREELERKMKNWKMPQALDDAVTLLCRHFKYKTGTELYYALVTERIGFAEVKELLAADLNKETEEVVVQATKRKVPTEVKDQASDALVIDRSLRNIDYKLAKCCNPIYGDKVFGFTTVSSGITIHRDDCPNALRMRERYPYRILPACWQDEAASKGAFLATIHIQAEDSVGFVNEVTEVVTKTLKLSMRSMSFNSLGGVITGSINIEVTGAPVVDTVIYNLLRIKGIQKVYRS